MWGSLMDLHPIGKAARASGIARLEPGERSQIFHQLLDAAPDAVVVVDSEGRILFVNLETERLFGYAREALLGHAVELLIPERIRRSHQGHRVDFMGAPHTRPMGSGVTLFGRKRDGSEFPVEISLSPLRTENEVLISASIRDVSERKQDELERRRIQDHLLSAIECIQGAFAIFDVRDRLVLCNSAYRQIMGVGLPGSVLGRSFRELVTASVETGIFDSRGGPELLSRWAAYRADPSGSMDLDMSGGERLRVVERRTPDGGAVSSIIDVTDAVTREEALRHAQALAEQGSAAKSEFLASMSHELRTPLNAVLGFAQLLQRDKKTPLSPRQQERVEHVVRGGEHLLRLIDDVLDLARIEAGGVLISLERVNLAEVLSEVEATLAPMGTRAEVRVSVEPTPKEALHVIADRTRLKQILMNYGSNAIKYGKAGGSVRFHANARSDRVRITAVDDGWGIAVDKQASLFQPFQRAGQEAGPIEGTGIGLVISKRLAELMGGAVGFESTEARGSHFWVELPAPAGGAGEVDLAGQRGAESPGLAAADGPRSLIVYVEDNPSNIAFMQDLLADFDRVELLTASSGELGIELIRARLPQVVIMDVNLPGMSGIEASRQLKQWPETRDIPIVALSAAAMIRDAARVAGAGFYRYLTKPVKVDELCMTLEELLGPSPSRASG